MFPNKYIQGWAKEWSLGCVNSRPAARRSQEAVFTQPRDHSFAQTFTIHEVTSGRAVVSLLPVPSPLSIFIAPAPSPFPSELFLVQLYCWRSICPSENEMRVSRASGRETISSFISPSVARLALVVHIPEIRKTWTPHRALSTSLVHCHSLYILHPFPPPPHSSSSIDPFKENQLSLSHSHR